MANKFRAGILYTVFDLNWKINEIKSFHSKYNDVIVYMSLVKYIFVVTIGLQEVLHCLSKNSFVNLTWTLLRRSSNKTFSAILESSSRFLPSLKGYFLASNCHRKLTKPKEPYFDMFP